MFKKVLPFHFKPLAGCPDSYRDTGLSASIPIAIGISAPILPVALRTRGTVNFTICLFILLLSNFSTNAQTKKQQWVDSVFQTLTPTEKISQLFIIPVSTYATTNELNSLSSQLKKHKPGGLLITHSAPVSHVRLINKLQSASSVPLLVAARTETSLHQIMDSTIALASPLQLAAIANDTLLLQAGNELGRQMKTLGIHLNLSLNADVHVADDLYPNTLRYWGEDKKRVTTKTQWFMKGLHQQGVLVAAAHLANPKKDRHIVIKDSTELLDLNQLDTAGFYPYQKLMESGIDAIVTSHLDYSVPGKRKPIPAPISDIFISDIIKNKIGFKGLSIAEVPYLRKVSRKKRAGEAELLAFEIGNDLIIEPKNIPSSIKKISKLVRKDPKWQQQLDASVRKILSAKYDAGLANSAFTNPDNLLLRLQAPSAHVIQYKLADAAPTVLANTSALIPVQPLEGNTFASISIGRTSDNEFNHYLSKYVQIQRHEILALKDTVGLQKKVNKASVVIIGLFPPAKGITLQVAALIKKLTAKQAVIVCSFGDPEDLKFLENTSALLTTYAHDDVSQKAAAELIFGGISGQGKLPIAISTKLPMQTGFETKSIDRLHYSVPEDAGMDSRTLQKIKSIMQEAIDLGATPGCQVLVARHGKVIYEQSAGWFTYDKKIPVTEEAIYDLASVTKVTATLQTVMFMHEKGLIDINKKVSVYLPELKESNKKDFTIKDILTHQAGLWPFLPFWAQTVKDSTYLNEYYQTKPSADYPFPVADSLFAHKSMKDSLWQWIVRSKIREKVPHTVYDYRYSDMGFYMLQHLAEKMLNQPMHEFLEQNIYEPLGAYTVGFLPRNKFSANQIAPTENDKLFRRRLLIGYVHDQGAAMHGGIAGHAGLFGGANDMAKLGQMWLRKGSYGGQQFFKPETFDLFTAKQYADSRRGLGWDKPVQSDPAGPTSIFASPQTFGHTGFTGTCIWVDPQFDLVYIFLSNRVYPEMTNNKILNANIRPRIQDVIYQSIFDYCSKTGQP
jgi:beta-N-acetylhexosaminidase